MSAQCILNIPFLSFGLIHSLNTSYTCISPMGEGQERGRGFGSWGMAQVGLSSPPHTTFVHNPPHPPTYTTGQKIYCECHFLLTITANYCPCTVSADNYCRLLSLLLSVLRITVVYCAFYCQCCDLLSFTVLVLSLLQITVIYCPYRSPRASPGIAPQAEYTR